MMTEHERQCAWTKPCGEFTLPILPLTGWAVPFTYFVPLLLSFCYCLWNYLQHDADNKLTGVTQQQILCNQPASWHLFCFTNSY